MTLRLSSASASGGILLPHTKCTFARVYAKPRTYTHTTDKPPCGRRPAAAPAPVQDSNQVHQAMQQEANSGKGEEVKALWSTETTLLDSLMYRNKNQHGRAGYWKRLQVRL